VCKRINPSLRFIPILPSYLSLSYQQNSFISLYIAHPFFQVLAMAFHLYPYASTLFSLLFHHLGAAINYLVVEYFCPWALFILFLSKTTLLSQSSLSFEGVSLPFSTIPRQVPSSRLFQTSHSLYHFYFLCNNRQKHVCVKMYVYLLIFFFFLPFQISSRYIYGV